MNHSVKMVLTLVFTLMLFGQTDADKKAVEAAIADYVDGIYLVKPERIDNGIDVTLRKYGYWFNPRTKAWSDGSEMNFKQLRHLAANWNKDNRNVDPKTGIREIKILDILDKTASAKLTAHWGIDYFHLSKEDGKWKIVNVIWQSHPPKE